MKVKCVNWLVDGLTKEKEYNVTDVYVRKDGVLYGLIDDYGTYNEFKSERFEIIGNDKIEVLTESKGVRISILLA